jgi:SAM-dependent methyltransferase
VYIVRERVKQSVPTVSENRRVWGKEYSWPGQGDEWSWVWGGAETQWHATILPRIRRFLPASRVLEIGPGHGRWTRFLIDYADEYIGIDLNPECVSACRARFAGVDHAKFVANDGRSLTAVADNSVDFVFTFDSLVHVEIDAIGAYLGELSRKLRPDGVAFIHHSNLGEHRAAVKLARFLSDAAEKSRLTRRIFHRLRLISWEHWRAPSVTAQKLFDLCAGRGLVCVGQEIIDWGHDAPRMIDCFSIVTRPGSKWQRSNVVVRNPHFMREAMSAYIISEVYTCLGPTEFGNQSDKIDAATICGASTAEQVRWRRREAKKIKAAAR